MTRAATTPGGGVTKDGLVVDKVERLTIVRVKAVRAGAAVEANQFVGRAGGKAARVARTNRAVDPHALVKVGKIAIKDAVLQVAVGLWAESMRSSSSSSSKARVSKGRGDNERHV